MKAILKYPGSKWGIGHWIVSHLPSHRSYVEPYFGSGAVFFLKSPSEYEVINDKSGSIVNLFKMLRDHGPDLAHLIECTPWSREEYYESYHLTGDSLEDARRFLVRCWQAHGTRLNQRTGWRNRGSADGGHTTSLWCQLPERILSITDRLKHAEIENLPALQIIQRFQDDPDCLIYADPPYPLETRSKRKMYEIEMNNEDHIELLNALDKHSGPAVLSGYVCPLYNERLHHWHQVTLPTIAEKGMARTEVLWLNPMAAQRRQLTIEWEAQP